MKFIERDLPVTGDPAKRTPREEIIPVFEQSVLVEVRLAADASDSEKWGPPDAAFPVWPVQMMAVQDVVEAVEYVDSQREAEQGNDDDDDVDADEGGTMAAFFNDTAIPVGDLNKKNFAHKTSAAFLVDPRNRQPLPLGGTKIGPAAEYLDRRYLGEFWKDKKTGLVVPVAKRPSIATAVFTDGAMADYREFLYRLEMDRKKCAYLKRLEDEFQGLWPAEHWFIAILGHGTPHDETVKLYKDISSDFPNVHPYAFTDVRDGHEIGEDVASAMLNRK